MISEFTKAFLLILLAEMGDKTQIIAMTFASKYRMKDVLLGVVLGVLLNHGMAIALGRLFSKVIPLDYIQIFAGIIFIIFAYMSLKDEEMEEDGERKEFSPIITVAFAFFIGELGDKTQLTAMTLSAEANYPLIILMGTTAGMVVTSGIGIIVGSKIGKKMDDLVINIVSSLVFFTFGSLKLISHLGIEQIYPIIIIALAIELVLVYKFYKYRKSLELSPIQLAAEKLYKETSKLNDIIEDICLGESKCGGCKADGCLLGYMRNILNKAREDANYRFEEYKDIDLLIRREFDDKKVLDALALIKKESELYGWPKDEDFVINQISYFLEEYLFNKKIGSSYELDEYLIAVKKEDIKKGTYLEEAIK